MSGEVILKAVAKAIADVGESFEARLFAIGARLDELQPSVSKSDVQFMVNELKDIHLEVLNELQKSCDDAINKTNFVEQELRKEIVSHIEAAREGVYASIQTLTDNIEALSKSQVTDEHLVRLEQSVLDKANELNNGTITLIDIAADSLRNQLKTTEQETDDKIEEVVEAIVTVQKAITEHDEELLTVHEKIESLKTVAGYIGRDGNDGLGVDADFWQPGIYRKGSIVQRFHGQTYQAAGDTIAEPGEDANWDRVGTLGFRHTGTFDPNRSYDIGDMFTKDFGTFLVTEGGKIVMLVGRGAKGNTGERGLASTVPGPKGDNGVSIKSVINDEEGFVLEMTDGTMHTVLYPNNVLTLNKIKSLVSGADDFESFKSMFNQL